MTGAEYNETIHRRFLSMLEGKDIHLDSKLKTIRDTRGGEILSWKGHFGSRGLLRSIIVYMDTLGKVSIFDDKSNLIDEVNII